MVASKSFASSADLAGKQQTLQVMADGSTRWLPEATVPGPAAVLRALLLVR
jgi:hypothetical protein